MENQQTEKQNTIISDRRSTLLLIAVALIVLGAVFIYIALSQPKISNELPSESTAKESVVASYNTTELANNTADERDYNNEQRAQAVTSVKYPINLNTCTAQELMMINEIGEARANAIIAYREHLGGYTSVEQLKNISGIGDAIYNAIAPYVTV